MKYLLFILMAIVFTNSYAKDFAISSNIGVACPLGNFKDNSKIYARCIKSLYGNHYKVKIENTSMDNSIYYELGLSYNIFEDLKLKMYLYETSNSFKGINILTSKIDPKTSLLIDNSINPEFNSTSLSIGINYNAIRIDKLAIFVEVEPSIAFIKYNKFTYHSAWITPYIIEDKISETSYGISGKVGVEYSISTSLLLNLSCKYLVDYIDYNNGSLSTATFCFPLDNYYTNAEYVIPSIGISYKIF